MTDNDSGQGDADALRTENEELKRQLEEATAEAREQRSHLWRRFFAVVLAVLAVVATAAAVDALWLKTTLQDEDTFVSTFQPLPQEDAVATAIALRVVSGVADAVGVEAFVAEALPEELQFAVAPITESIQDVIATNAGIVVGSDAFVAIWSESLRAAHRASSAVLSGNDGLLIAEDGQVAIDLDEMATMVLERVEAAGVPLPDVNVSIEPIVVYESDQLVAAQGLAQLVNTIGWFIPFIALVLMAGALWASPDRRWMTMFLGYGTAIGMLIALAALRVTRNAVVSGIEDPVSADAAAAVWDTTFAWLVAASWGLIVLAFIIGFVAWAFGPSPRAREFSAWTANTIDRWRRPEEEEPSSFTQFLADSKRTIQVVVIVLGLVFVIFGPPLSGMLVILTTVVVIVIVVLVEVFAGPTGRPNAPIDETPDLVDS